MVRPTRMVSLRPALAGLAAGLLLAGCAQLPPLPERPRDVFTVPIVNRGHAVTADQLRQVIPGVSTRADVQAALGSPSHTSTFTDDEWYYISAVSQQRPARAMAVRDQRVVVVAFDARGIVREVRQVEDRDMPRIAFATRETPTPGTERTFLQILFGNVGRVGPGAGALTPQTPGSAGAGSGR